MKSNLTGSHSSDRPADAWLGPGHPAAPAMSAIFTFFLLFASILPVIGTETERIGEGSG